MKTIIIDGIEYELVPINKSVEKPAETKSLIDEYEGIRKAEPTVYDWKDELAKKRQINLKNSYLQKMPKQDRELDKFGDLIVGEGIEQTF